MIETVGTYGLHTCPVETRQRLFLYREGLISYVRERRVHRQKVTGIINEIRRLDKFIYERQLTNNYTTLDISP